MTKNWSLQLGHSLQTPVVFCFPYIFSALHNSKLLRSYPIHHYEFTLNLFLTCKYWWLPLCGMGPVMYCSQWQRVDVNARMSLCCVPYDLASRSLTIQPPECPSSIPAYALYEMKECLFEKCRAGNSVTVHGKSDGYFFPGTDWLQFSYRITWVMNTGNTG